MGAALKGKPEDSLNPPNGIEIVRINRNTGLLASPDDPNSIFEVFRIGGAPTIEQNYDDRGYDDNRERRDDGISSEISKIIGSDGRELGETLILED